MKEVKLISFLLAAVFLLLSGCVQEQSLKAGEEKEIQEAGGKAMKGKILFIIAPENFRDEELLKPKKVLENAGYEVEIASTKTGKAVGMLGTEIEVSKNAYEVSPSEYKAIVLVGGIGANVFFDDEKIHKLLKEAYEEGKIVAAICISPVTLAKAGLLKGKKATVWQSEAKVIESYGAKYTGSDVERDGRIITASGPEAAEKFGETIAKALEENQEN